MLNYNYGVAQSLNYAVARISTSKAISSRIKTYGVTHNFNYAVTNPSLREILTYEDYAVPHYEVYGVTKFTRVVPFLHSNYGVTMIWGIRRNEDYEEIAQIRHCLYGVTI